MVDVKRKKNESVSSLLRRFSRLVQRAGTIKLGKSARFFERKPSVLQEKNRAIMREHLRALRKRLDRTGRFNEDLFREEKKKLKRTINL
ncbi:MAG: 30S ribosomal protein S21 [Candidatus Yanofskybacteria bacterium CG10_big_fil_rev_8_21_14_0_10_46_23]|uniref:Small ribosomal subunit protein bS21 n=1 Tax=Candidatus Yanofskybacteria bacterium CG10_big_fil_rev_8_21_14_0_10_46_23 TaxID=1975098 RepID=A0A2H0R3T5_9BACT|nr:MAG: 30S ribosomal protein S21 [Candidatus Yanofskybacteria bacterium CG10_big_fil_rev_8_21_14_0_10_46_23]